MPKSELIISIPMSELIDDYNKLRDLNKIITTKNKKHIRELYGNFKIIETVESIKHKFKKYVNLDTNKIESVLKNRTYSPEQSSKIILSLKCIHLLKRTNYNIISIIFMDRKSD